MKVPRVSERLESLRLGTRTSEQERWSRERDRQSEPIIFLGKRTRRDLSFRVAFLDSFVFDDVITSRAMSLLFYMLKRANRFSFEIKIKPKEAMQELGITREAYNRWIKEFIKREIIEKIDAYTYKLKPNKLID
ncbi:MAG: hypothetical protein QXP36_14635 [Conexivisphaerales archaeon]